MQHKFLSILDSHSPSQEQVENTSGADIQAFRCVNYTTIGISYPSIVLGVSGGDVKGITSALIPNGGQGMIMAYGLIYGLDTSAWTAPTASSIRAEKCSPFPHGPPIIAPSTVSVFPTAYGPKLASCQDIPSARVHL